MCIKKQSENKIRKNFPGFLLIECLIALLIASWLMFIFAVVQKKSIEGQIYIRQQFAHIHTMSTLVHGLMLRSDAHDMQNVKQGAFTVTSKPVQYRIVSTSYPVPWITSKKLPIQPITVTLQDNQHNNSTISTALLTRGS